MVRKETSIMHDWAVVAAVTVGVTAIMTQLILRFWKR